MDTPPNPPNVSKLELAETPPYYWMVDTNHSNAWNFITVPGPGSLWVFYQPYTGKAAVQVWHRGGATEEVKIGENTFRVGEGDMIVYQLLDPKNDRIRLAYRLAI